MVLSTCSLTDGKPQLAALGVERGDKITDRVDHGAIDDRCIAASLHWSKLIEFKTRK